MLLAFQLTVVHVLKVKELLHPEEDWKWDQRPLASCMAQSIRGFGNRHEAHVHTRTVPQQGRVQAPVLKIKHQF